jgi:hypothetical protein
MVPNLVELHATYEVVASEDAGVAGGAQLRDGHGGVEGRTATRVVQQLLHIGMEVRHVRAP